MNAKPAVAIVGAGRVGTALGILLRRRGYVIRGVVCRSIERAEEQVRRIGGGTPCDEVAEGVQGAELVFLTVPDDALGETARRVRAAREFDAGDLLVHTSGVYAADVLRAEGERVEDGRSLSGRGRVGCLSMHPIQAIPEPETGADRLIGACFGLEGDAHAVARGERIVRDIGGVPISVRPGGKPLYHAAACVASNYLVALIDAGLTLYERAGVDRKDALTALSALLEATLTNARSLGVPEALTGPIDRGDEATVRAHLHALNELPTESERERLESLYRTLGLYALDLAKEKRGSLASGHREIERMLKENEGHQ